MPKTIKVAVITKPQGAHLADYFGSLAKIEEAEAVALVDPTGKTADAARKALGDKLKEVFKDSAEMLKRFEPHLAVVSLEAVEAQAYTAHDLPGSKVLARQMLFLRPGVGQDSMAAAQYRPHITDIVCLTLLGVQLGGLDWPPDRLNTRHPGSPLWLAAEA